MKIVSTAVAAMLMTGGVAAQTVDPAAAPAPVEAMQAAPAADAAAPAAPVLTEKDGKWWNGDRPATKEEIAAHKQAMKAGNPG